MTPMPGKVTSTTEKKEVCQAGDSLMAGLSSLLLVALLDILEMNRLISKITNGVYFSLEKLTEMGTTNNSPRPIF